MHSRLLKTIAFSVVPSTCFVMRFENTVIRNRESSEKNLPSASVAALNFSDNRNSKIRSSGLVTFIDAIQILFPFQDL